MTGRRNGQASKYNRGGEYFDPLFLMPEKIIAEQNKSGTKYFLVKWTGLSYADATWESLEFVKETLNNPYIVSKYTSYCVEKPPANFSRQGKIGQYSLNDIVSRIKGFTFENNNQLRDYQVKGVAWLVHNWLHQRGCILGDEMGLGKTVQVMIYLETLRRLYHVRGPFLIIAPLATIGHWEREAAGWISANVVTYMGIKKARDRVFMNEFYYKRPASTVTKVRKSTPVKFDILVTTYEWMQKDSVRFSGIHWGAVVIDEGHRLKNENAALFKELAPVKTEHRVVLTGTPVQNNIGELYSLLKFLDPKTVPKKAEEFLAEYTPLTAEKLEVLFELLGPRLLRREKENVEKSIPPKVEILVKVGLTKFQKEVYKMTINKNRVLLESGKAKPMLKNVCMELRKVCNHPWLAEDAEEMYLRKHGFTDPSRAPNDFVMRHLISSCSKMTFLDKLLEKFRKEGERVLIFSQFVLVLNVITDYLEYRKYPYETLSGNTGSFERQRAVDRFQDDSHDSFVFLISTRAGGCGINLTKATKVVIYDSDWNPQNDLQAQARCHRIGQKKEVEVYRVLTENTYEERMFEVASQKLGLDRVVLSAADTGDFNGASAMGLTTKEIENVLKHGAYDLYKNDNDDEQQDEDIDAILERSKKIVHGAKQDGGSAATTAVRGLAGFSKVKFAGADDIDEEDPDFWSKVLPEKLDSESLSRKINGANPPTSSSDVKDFVQKLESVCVSEVESFGDGPLYKQEDLYTQRALEGLILETMSLPQFEEHLELLKNLQKMAHEPTTRKRKTTVTRNDDSDSEESNTNNEAVDAASSGLQTALGIWNPPMLNAMMESMKPYGYGRWDEITSKLRGSRSYPKTDLLTPGVRKSLVASKVECLVDYFIENKDKVGTPEQQPTKAAGKKRKAQQKKKKKADSDSDSDSDSFSSDSDSEEDPMQNLQEGLVNKFMAKDACYEHLVKLKEAITDYNTASAAGMLFDNGLTVVTGKGNTLQTAPFTLKKGVRDGSSLTYTELEGAEIPCGTPICVEVTGKPGEKLILTLSKDVEGATKKRNRMLRSTLIDLSEGEEAKKVYLTVPGEPGTILVHCYKTMKAKDGKVTKPNCLKSAREFRNKADVPPAGLTLTASKMPDPATTPMKALTALFLALAQVKLHQVTSWGAFLVFGNPIEAIELPTALKNLIKKGGKEVPEDMGTPAGAAKVATRYLEDFKKNGYTLKEFKKIFFDVVMLGVEAASVRAPKKVEEQTPKKEKKPKKEETPKKPKKEDTPKKEKKKTSEKTGPPIKTAVLKSLLKSLKDNGVRVTTDDAVDVDDICDRTTDVPKDALTALIAGDDKGDWMPARQKTDFQNILKDIETTKTLVKYLRDLIATAESDKTSPHTMAPVRNLWRLIEKNLGTREKLPTWWKAKEGYDVVKGLSKHGRNFGAILWDENLAFFNKTKKESGEKTVPKDKPFIQVVPRLLKKFNVMYDVMLKVAKGELEVPENEEPPLNFEGKKEKTAGKKRSQPDTDLTPYKGMYPEEEEDRAIEFLNDLLKEGKTVEEIKEAFKGKWDQPTLKSFLKKGKKEDEAVKGSENEEAPGTRQPSPKEEKEEVSEPETIAPTPVETPTPKQEGKPLQETAADAHPEPVVLDVDGSLEY
eukprot:TRINITY_DN13406_c0_g1_i2.p1 TRINITY_DN13406_c0_g1~~TRINITY_DN13406_c0_g1_i2.p1  ORF type:complete len:1853 (+),score=614.80 TRINITY_DN13406_c0_g1_i2:658-5559(+)